VVERRKQEKRLDVAGGPGIDLVGLDAVLPDPRGIDVGLDVPLDAATRFFPCNASMAASINVVFPDPGEERRFTAKTFRAASRSRIFRAESSADCWICLSISTFTGKLYTTPSSQNGGTGPSGTLGTSRRIRRGPGCA
jgi:hypothetical protein